MVINRMLGSDYYSTLGIRPNSTTNEIRQAYKDLAIKYHPDKMRNNPSLDPVDFKNIKQAYDALLKRKKQGGATQILKQLIRQIPTEQLACYDQILDDDDESDQSDPDQYLIEQTLSLNELKQMATDNGLSGVEDQIGVTYKEYKALQDTLTSSPVTIPAPVKPDYRPNVSQLQTTIRLRRPVFQVI